MKLRHLILVVALGLSAAGAGQAFDSVKTTKSSLVGRVVGMSAANVELEQTTAGAAKTTNIPANQVQMIFFDGEAAGLKEAKAHVLAGRYAEALAALERIRDEPDAPDVQQDFQFYKALCAAKLVLAGSGKAADAGRKMKAFADANGKSYHYFEASELIGDLLVAVQQYGQAAEYYARLEKAPWPDYQMRAGVAEGRALFAQGKIEEAQNAFDRVVATEADGDLAKQQRTAAKLGRAGARWLPNDPTTRSRWSKKSSRRPTPMTRR